MLQAITGDSWTLHEIRVGGLPAKPTWTLAASINVWETPLAMDGNLTTFWSPWEATPAGTQIDVRMPEPVTAGDLRVVTGQQYPIKVEVLNNDWTIVPVKGPAPLPKLDLRLEAIKAVKREGIRYVLAQRGTEPLGMLGVAMGEAPGDWGLKLVAAYEFFALYHIE